MALKTAHFSLLALSVITESALAAGGAATSERVPTFNRDVRPILSENCLRCHGNDPKNRKGKFRLDDRESALKKEAFVPGNPDESEMIRRLETNDPHDKMPPPEMHKTVTPAQIGVLRRWIAAGAIYEPHWSYAPVNRPPLPRVNNTKWPQTDVDYFILSRLEEQSIEPSPAAARRTLLRRVSLDLTGSPPTPAEVERFVNDPSPLAYQKEVERLLATPQFGERMAVPWLDAVRFADTVGYHGDQNQNIFPYRDYVIDSFNRNKPFDQFTVEQIAGDLLPNATTEQKIASGFNRLNMVTREGGAQPKEYLAKYAADRARTISTAWLGSTLGCAECHDHKYDPFTQVDFYSMEAFFSDIKQWGVYNDYAYTPNPELRHFNNDYPFPPEIFVTNRYLLEHVTALREDLGRFLNSETAAIKSDSARRKAFKEWRIETGATLKAAPDGWLIDTAPRVSVVKTNSQTTVLIQRDGSLLCTGEPTNGEAYQVQISPPSSWISALRLELLPNSALHGSSLRKEAESAEVTLSAEVKRVDGKSGKLKFHRSDATTRLPEYSSGFEMLGVNPVWKLDGRLASNRQYAVYLLDPPLRLAPGEKLSVRIESHDVGSFRIATSPIADLAPLKSGASPELQRAFRRSNPGSNVIAAWLISTTNSPDAFARLKQLDEDILDCRNGVTPTLVTVSVTNRLVTRVLPRGNWQDESGAIVQPAVPHFLPQPDSTNGERLTRLDLASWLVSPRNPLTARAFMNRLWKQFYGNALSSQPEELGAQGELPSHPELMDWLAAEFMESGWDVKHMVRLLVLSSTYRQDSKYRPELREIDPNNRLLARQNPRRLDAEFVRDNALFIAGLLNTEIGGPSRFPYEPAGYLANIQFPDREYHASLGAEQYRRGVYTQWQRTFLHPMLANFDAPSREECTVDRVVSTTPQQALTLLNDPTFVEAARCFAEELLRAPKIKDDKARINLAFQTALLRPAKPVEIDSMSQFLDSQRTCYATNFVDADKLLGVGMQPPERQFPAAEEAAWTSVARVMLNLQETITRY
jgi:hypothetical protein